MKRATSATASKTVADNSRCSLAVCQDSFRARPQRKSEKSPVLRGETEIDTAKIKEMSSFDEPKMKLRTAVWINSPKGGVAAVQ